jgi:hypothetical protein
MSKKNKKDESALIEEKLFGYYFIARYTAGGTPYGITMEEAEEQGLLEEGNDSSDENLNLPF